MTSTREMLHRPVALMLAVALMGVFAACSSDSSSTSSPAATPSSSGSTLEQTKANVCGKLAQASTAVATFQANQNGDAASTVSSLATDLKTASSLLNTVGAADVADKVSSIASDLKKLAKSAPGDIAQLASEIQTEITTADEALACPSASATASASPTM